MRIPQMWGMWGLVRFFDMKAPIVLQALSSTAKMGGQRQRRCLLLRKSAKSIQDYSKHLKVNVQINLVGTWKAMNTDVKRVATQ